MKVTFEITFTEDGYKDHMICEDMPMLENGIVDKEKYDTCFKAIYEYTKSMFEK